MTSIEHSIREDDAHLLSTRQGAVIMKSLGDGVFVSKYSGKAAGGFVPLVTELWEKEASTNHKLVLFADCRTLTAYETSYRVDVTRWMIAHRAIADSYHLLSNSAIVRMGIQLANLVTGGMVESYSSANELEAKMRKLRPDFLGLDKL